MREIFVSNLAKELLGPTKINEEFVLSPYDEYILGILVPTDLKEPSEESQEIIDILAPNVVADDDQEIDEISTPLSFSPVLDPKRRSSTFGISFMVESLNTPSVEVCLTWARYPFGENHKWNRTPRHFFSPIKLDNSTNPIFISDCKQVKKDEAELSIYQYVKKIDENIYHITLKVLSEVKFRSREKLAEDSIFQPEIRINAWDGTKIVPIERNKLTKIENIQYRNRRVYARGHLCSATWANIDPQRYYEKNVDYPEAKSASPFCWVDSEIVPEKIRKKFILPEIRSDFFPLVSITSPNYGWNNIESVPILSSRDLSEIWDVIEIEKALTPLYNNYKNWIESEFNKCDLSEKKLLSSEFNKANNVCKRIKSGIEILKNNESARLAFCFANKAMDLQYSWALKQKQQEDEPLIWRPYQLAYILMVLESIVNTKSEYRDNCDLLWVSTGAGKTEAYLAIAAFTLAYRRRITEEFHGAGIGVISRYTLRLLSIQQFRRTLRIITACEYLRILERETGNYGWLPQKATYLKEEKYIWKNYRFSLGLWIGGSVKPNNLGDVGFDVPGALSILEQNKMGYGEPAQVLNCPVCNSILSFPVHLDKGIYNVFWVVQSQNNLSSEDFKLNNHKVKDIIIIENKSIKINKDTWVLSISFDLKENQRLTIIEDLWDNLTQIYPVSPLSASIYRPGYFFRTFINDKGNDKKYDFDIYCNNPQCELNTKWHEITPLGNINKCKPNDDVARSNYTMPQPFFREGTTNISTKIPIPAYTVDEQIYSRIPSMIISTVDKFARPSFEERAASLFGNVNCYHKIWGYYRQNQRKPSVASGDNYGHPLPAGQLGDFNYIRVDLCDTPDLIIQDELHLIEGPLGSMVGFYETAIDYLTSNNNKKIKYISSTATISNSEFQIQNLFDRQSLVFPLALTNIDDRFFIKNEPTPHQLEDGKSGRLYAGILASGRGPLTPIIRMWSKLMQTAWDYKEKPTIDRFWTLVGYFNAVRELGGAQALYWQDIPERISLISDNSNGPRFFEEELCQELSSRTRSDELPSILTLLEKEYPEAQDALFTTSMFGTGIDISRFGLMVVHGQPKTTSSYIQATGRVGRSAGALVPVFYRATRPRDLNHYEFFYGYHLQIDLNVEPVSVTPYTPSVIDRALGPLLIYILRNHPYANPNWMQQEGATKIIEGYRSQDIINLFKIFKERAKNQNIGVTEKEIEDSIKNKLDLWLNSAMQDSNLKYYEYSISTRPKYSVVLGDPVHQHDDYVSTVFKNAPQSLRDLEETTGFQTE